MKRNMGAVDKLVRLVVALLVIIAYYQEIVIGTFAIILLIFSSIFVTVFNVTKGAHCAPL